MSAQTVFELQALLKSANDATDVAKNRALAAGDDDAAWAEFDRLSRVAEAISALMLDAMENRLAKVVAALQSMLVTEQAHQSDLAGRLSETIRNIAGAAAPAVQPPAAAPSAAFSAAAPVAAPRPAPRPVRHAVDPNQRSVDLELLHPAIRDRVKTIIDLLATAKIPMKVFEAYRTPERQRHLFDKGRRGGAIVDRKKVVTFADAWQSFHQYGMAVDMVIDHPDFGMWETGGKADAFWKKYHEIADANGMEPLSFELPHIQLIDARASQLLAGEYPDGGDASWADNLSAAIARWPEAGKPPAPSAGERPAISAPTTSGAAGTGAVNWASLPGVVPAPFEGRFGGRPWRVDGDGIYLTAAGGAPERTPGTPLTVNRIIELFGPIIAATSRKWSIAPELLIMTIATETGIFRRDGFTGKRTFRWESHFKVRNVPSVAGTGEKGDYSAGPAQVMADTARGLNQQFNLGYDNKKDFKFFKTKPATPAQLGLYEPEICINLAGCMIHSQIAKTDANPILVAAAYNAGSVRASGTSIWGIHTHGDHLDRASKWFGDVCAALAVLGR